MSKKIQGFVYKRTKVRGYEFPFGTRYEFTALIFNQDMVGLKFNIPADYNTKVTVGNRVEIVMENPSLNNGFFIIRHKDTIRDLGPALVTDPTKRMKFFVGYITLPWKDYCTVHKPTRVEGVTGDITKIKVPVSLMDDRENMMCCTWVVDGVQIVDRIRVTKIIKTVPKTMTKTWEEPMQRVWFSPEGMTIKRMGEVLFVSNDVLPFECSDRMNHLKKDLLGTVKITMGYRLWCRWNNHRNAEDRKWMPTTPENVEFSDRSSVRLLQRFATKK